MAIQEPTAAPVPPYAYQPETFPQYVVRRTNGLAIASMVLGILWIWWIGSVLAVIFGFVSLKQIKERGEGGRGMAIAGLVLGLIGIVTLIGVFLLAAITAQANSKFDTIGNSLN